VTMADDNGKSTGKKAKDSGRLVHLRVRRQDGRDMPETRRWEEFKVPYLPQMNVNSALEQIRKAPVTVDGKTVPPPSGRRPAWRRSAAPARW
jgi:succinate dehydrogenase / fumarate reductase, iron-sulfur subunit